VRDTDSFENRGRRRTVVRVRAAHLRGNVSQRSPAVSEYGVCSGYG
jgi:hypothetical protein